MESVITIPLLLIIAYVLSKIKAEKYGRIVFTGIMIFLIITSLMGMAKAAARHRYYFQLEGGEKKYQKIVEVLSAYQPNEVIVPGLGWKYRLSYYLAASHGLDKPLNLTVSEGTYKRLKENTCLIFDGAYADIYIKSPDVRIKTIFHDGETTLL